MKNSQKKIISNSLTLGGDAPDISISSKTFSDKKRKNSSFFLFFYIFTTIVNSILASYLLFNMYKLLLITLNYEILLFLISYVSQWFIASFLSIIIFILLHIGRTIHNNNSNNSGFTEQFNERFRFFLSVINILNLPQGIYIIDKLCFKESKEYNLNFHKNNILLYIFLTVDLIISSAISLIAIYYFIKNCFRLKNSNTLIDEQFIENLKDELKLNDNNQNQRPLTSDGLNNINHAIQIKKINNLICSPELNRKKKSIKNKSISTMTKSEDMTKIKQEIMDFTLGKDKKRDSLFNEIKKEIEISNSPLKRSIFSESKDLNILKFDDNHFENFKL